MSKALHASVKCGLVVGIGILGIFMASAARAEAAKDQLEAGLNQVSALMESKTYEKQPPGERRASTRKILDGIFDWPEMAKRALGQHWSERTPPEQQEFVSLFADLFGWAYIRKLETADVEKIIYVDETVEGDRAEVRTKLVVENDEDVPVDYRLALREGGQWGVYDIVFDRVNLIANYRAQFNRILRQSSYQELVVKLKEKSGGDNAGTTSTSPSESDKARSR